MTILEVLFAIMVTTIGLLGALTLLPVAATQARKARTADASTSAVTAAVGFFDARGMRKPQNWIAYDADQRHAAVIPGPSFRPISRIPSVRSRRFAKTGSAASIRSASTRG